MAVLTQAQLDALIQSLADRKGAKSITFADQTISFESIQDVREFVAQQQAQIAGSRTRYAATRKGV
jgi:hypothetical protein